MDTEAAIPPTAEEQPNDSTTALSMVPLLLKHDRSPSAPAGANCRSRPPVVPSEQHLLRSSDPEKMDPVGIIYGDVGTRQLQPQRDRQRGEDGIHPGPARA